jgi:hypothetical protein
MWKRNEPHYVYPTSGDVENNFAEVAVSVPDVNSYVRVEAYYDEGIPNCTKTAKGDACNKNDRDDPSLGRYSERELYDYGAFTSPIYLHSEPTSRVQGRVVDHNGAPSPFTYVELCSGAALSTCRTVVTRFDGSFGPIAGPTGSWSVKANPPTRSTEPPATARFTVRPYQTYDALLSFREPKPVPPPLTNIAVNNRPADGRPQSVYYRAPFVVDLRTCTGARVTVSVYPQRSDGFSFTLSELSPGVFTGGVPQLYPNTGNAVVKVFVTCPSGEQTTANVDIYIDPAGTVVDTLGNPVEGAIVTLLSADNVNGPYTPVPDGDAVMSPSNRSNPMESDQDGVFHWDVLAGWYRVTASKPGCVSTDGLQTYAQTTPLQVPPAQLDLRLILDCRPPDTTPPVLTVTSQLSSVTSSQAAEISFTMADDSSDAILQCGLDDQIFDERPNYQCDSPIRFDNLAEGPHRFGLAATDGHGNSTATEVKWIVDTKAPTVIGTPDRPANSQGWWNSPVTLTWALTDQPPSAGLQSPPSPTVVAAEGTTTVDSGPGCDLAENCATGAYTVNIDRTPPMIVWTGPNEGSLVAPGTTAPTCVASDSLSGLDGTCAVTIAGPGTTGPGQVIATGTVRDRAGNTATSTRSYTVTTPCHLCVTAANGTGVQVDGTSRVSVTGVANIASTSVGAISARGSSSFTAMGLDAKIETGGTVTTAGGSTISPNPVRAGPAATAFAWLTPPTPAPGARQTCSVSGTSTSCPGATRNGTTIKLPDGRYDKLTIGSDAKVELGPGTYGALIVTSSSTVTLRSGQYVFDGAGMTLGGSSTVTAVASGGVQVHLAGRGTTGATLSIGGSSRLTIGTAFGPNAESLTADRTNSATITIAGSSSATFGGLVYLPELPLTVTGSSTIIVTGGRPFVVSKLVVQSSSALKIS